jgi:hypothetical protein
MPAITQAVIPPAGSAFLEAVSTVGLRPQAHTKMAEPMPSSLTTWSRTLSLDGCRTSPVSVELESSANDKQRSFDPFSYFSLLQMETALQVLFGFVLPFL